MASAEGASRVKGHRHHYFHSSDADFQSRNLSTDAHYRSVLQWLRAHSSSGFLTGHLCTHTTLLNNQGSKDNGSLPESHTRPQSCLYPSLQEILVEPVLAGCHVTHRLKQDKA